MQDEPQPDPLEGIYEELKRIRVALEMLLLLEADSKSGTPGPHVFAAAADWINSLSGADQVTSLKRLREIIREQTVLESPPTSGFPDHRADWERERQRILKRRESDLGSHIEQ